jgi:uncharacterized membrane protein (DUF106 family)
METQAVIAIASILLSFFIVLFSVLIYALLVVTKKMADLEDKLMAKSLTEYADKKQREVVNKGMDKIIHEELKEVDRYETPLEKDEVE